MFLTPTVGFLMMLSAVIVCGIVYGSGIGQQFFDDDFDKLSWPSVGTISGLITLYFTGALLYEPEVINGSAATITHLGAQEYTALVLIIGFFAACFSALMFTLFISVAKDPWRKLAWKCHELRDLLLEEYDDLYPQERRQKKAS